VQNYEKVCVSKKRLNAPNKYSPEIDHTIEHAVEHAIEHDIEHAIGDDINHTINSESLCQKFYCSCH